MSDVVQPPVRLLETSLYASDLAAARAFYADVIGLDVVFHQPGRHVFFRCGDGMLLVFDPDAAAEPTAPGRVPPHGAHGPGHIAFAVDPSELHHWRARLEAAGFPVEAEIDWPAGGRSLYTRDPAGNSIEFATPSIWS